MLIALLWNLALTAGMAIVLAAVCRLHQMRKRPALRHALWLLVLAKLVTPPLIPVPMLPEDTRSHDTIGFVAPPNEASGHRRVASEEMVQANPDADTATVVATNAAAHREASGSRSPWSSLGQQRVTYLRGLLAISLIGTLVLLAVHGVRAVRLNRWLRRAGGDNSRLAECCSDVASSLGMRAEVRTRVINVRIAPFLLVWRRPILVLPRQLLDDLSPQQLRSILAHELAHYLRWDHWSNRFAFLVKVLMWWNPIAWWAHRELRAAQELCCDAIAIDRTDTNRRCYATTLLTALDFIQAEPCAPRVLALGMGSRASILRRFEMIGETQLSHRLSRWTLAILLVSMIPLVCLPVRSQEQQPPPDTKPIPSEAKAPTAPADAPGKTSGEAAKETELVAGTRPDRVFLVAILRQRGPSDAESIPTAWLTDRDGRGQTILRDGTAFKVGDTSATVEGIVSDAALLKVGDNLRLWRLGMSFAAVLDAKTVPLAKYNVIEAPAKEKTSGKDKLRSTVQIEVLDDPKVMILRGKEEDVKRMAELIRQIEKGRFKSGPSGKDDEKAGETDQKLHLEVYRLDGLGVDSQTVLRVLQTLLAGHPEVRMELDPVNRNLVVLASPDDHAVIKEMLVQLRPQAAKTPKSKPKGPQTSEASPKDGPKLRFAFRYQNWNEVLEWYAEQAELSLVSDGPIPGTFNYTDDKTYTVTEAMDLLNSVLLTKGYVLLRRDRLLLVVNVADGIPSDLVPRVTIEELGKHGKFELVSILFPLGHRDAETVRNEIRPLLGCGNATALPQTRQILVTDRAGIMRTISEVIDSVPEPKP